MAIAFVVPCYNEAKRTDFTAFKTWQGENPDVEFFFVNDGSTDDTLRVLNSHFDNEHVIDLSQNQGKAEAVRQAMAKVCEEGRHSHIGFLDADLATPLTEIKFFKEQVDKGKLVIMGSRWLHLGANIKRKWYRHYLGRVFATAASILLNLPVYDTQCGAKLFGLKELKAVVGEPFISKWIFDVELFMRLQKSGVPISTWYEIPLENWEDVAGSRLKLTDFLKAPLEMLALYKKYGRS